MFQLPFLEITLNLSLQEITSTLTALILAYVGWKTRQTEQMAIKTEKLVNNQRTELVNANTALLTTVSELRVQAGLNPQIDDKVPVTNTEAIGQPLGANNPPKV